MLVEIQRDICREIYQAERYISLPGHSLRGPGSRVVRVKAPGRGGALIHNILYMKDLGGAVHSASRKATATVPAPSGMCALTAAGKRSSTGCTPPTPYVMPA